MHRSSLIRVSAFVEMAGGGVLLVLPSAGARLLFDRGLGSAESLTIARIGGAALLSIAVICWLVERFEHGAVMVVVGGLSVYNTLTAALLGYAALVLRMHGLALWPAILLHAVLLGWCVARLRADSTAAADPRGDEGR
jgi:hypothetical protein